MKYLTKEVDLNRNLVMTSTDDTLLIFYISLGLIVTFRYHKLTDKQTKTSYGIKSNTKYPHTHLYQRVELK